jgi:hypothetical protein
MFGTPRLDSLHFALAKRRYAFRLACVPTVFELSLAANQVLNT